MLQGLAAALLTPQTFGLIRDMFPPGLFALVVGSRVLPGTRGARRDVRLDLVGALLMGVVAVLVVLPLVDGRTQGWPAWIFAVLASAVPVLALFVVQQRRRVRAERSSLIEFGVLAKRSYVSDVVFTPVFFGTVVGFSLTVGLFLQIGLGYTAMKAALIMEALAVGAFLGSGIGAWAVAAVGRPILPIGLTIMAAGAVILLVTLHGVRVTVGSRTCCPASPSSASAWG